MEQEVKQPTVAAPDTTPDIRGLVREAIEEFTRKEAAKAEPAYRNELVEERKRREQLERRVNELVQENARSRKQAEEAERSAAIRGELQRLGVTKVDLAFKAVKDDVQRTEDGRLVASSESGPLSLREYLTNFVSENPEFLPARNLGGSGVTGSGRGKTGSTAGVDLDKIKPGMNPEELERVRQEIARIASQSLGGL
jgi:uncharacterized protein YhaN